MVSMTMNSLRTPSPKTSGHISTPPTGPLPPSPLETCEKKEIIDNAVRRKLDFDAMTLIETPSTEKIIHVSFGSQFKIAVAIVLGIILAVVYHYMTHVELQGEAVAVYNYKNLPEAIYLGGFNNPMSYIDFIWNHEHVQELSVLSDEEIKNILL